MLCSDNSKLCLPLCDSAMSQGLRGYWLKVIPTHCFTSKSIKSTSHFCLLSPNTSSSSCLALSVWSSPLTSSRENHTLTFIDSSSTAGRVFGSLCTPPPPNWILKSPTRIGFPLKTCMKSSPKTSSTPSNRTWRKWVTPTTSTGVSTTPRSVSMSMEWCLSSKRRWRPWRRR